ncbi:MAG: hypothetical protein H8E57_05135 [Candidatus Cloacimonetes bacterium]|nr:hypothetical protein [Candidatus Cloacimonadota bacterium]
MYKYSRKDKWFMTWDKERILALSQKSTEYAMEKVCKYIIKEIKRDMRDSKHGVSYIIKGKEHRASKPDESPAILTNTLYDALEYKIETHNNEIIGKIGVNIDKGLGDGYALYLEVGTARMNGARPYLRNTVFQNKRRIVKILEKGAF